MKLAKRNDRGRASWIGLLRLIAGVWSGKAWVVSFRQENADHGSFVIGEREEYRSEHSSEAPSLSI